MKTTAPWCILTSSQLPPPFQDEVWRTGKYASHESRALIFVKSEVLCEFDVLFPPDVKVEVACYRASKNSTWKFERQLEQVLPGSTRYLTQFLALHYPRATQAFNHCKSDDCIEGISQAGSHSGCCTIVT
jgi:hypothetical protein